MPDIDALDCENPLAVTEYVNDIFSYWFRVEVRSREKFNPFKIRPKRSLSCHVRDLNHSSPGALTAMRARVAAIEMLHS